MSLELTFDVVLWAILVLVVMTVLMVGLTLGIKIRRSIVRRRRRSRTRKLQPALASSVSSGELHPDLRNLGRGDSDALTVLMVDYLSLLLSGAGRDRLVQLAEETGLVDRCLSDLNSWGRRRKAQAAQGLGYFGGPRAVATLTNLLGNRDETLRAVAARALARLGAPGAGEGLAGSPHHPSEITP